MRRKSFVISTIAVPLLLVGVLVVPAVIGARNVASESRIALVDRTGVLSEGLAERLSEGGFSVEVVVPDSPDEEDARLRATDGNLSGLLELDEGTLERGAARWIGRRAPTTIRSLGIRQAVTQAALEVRLDESETAAGLSALLSGGSLEVVSVEPEDSDEVERATGMAAGFLGSFLLYFALLVYGTQVMRAVLEEKTGRIVEVIVSSVRPWEFMLGKILGVGAVGLTQLGIWILSGALIFSLGIPALLAVIPAGEVPPEIMEALPGVEVALFFLVCFLLGYFIYASLFAAVGAMCSSEDEAQHLQFPVVSLVIVPVILLMPVLERPESAFAIWLSLFPFFSPILMFARVAAGAAAWWEAALSVVLMVATLFATAWVAGRIYRVGILMQGKRPTAPELWRWLRQA